MLSKTFTSGRIRRADYNPESQQLDLHWDNKSALAYKQVPQEVFRRLCSVPNPATYWEDRIAEEYPKGVPMVCAAAPTGTKTLNDLFGDRSRHRSALSRLWGVASLNASELWHGPMPKK